jgi:hypothetical protein
VHGSNARYYASCCVLTMPSRHEGIGSGALGASSTGRVPTAREHIPPEKRLFDHKAVLQQSPSAKLKSSVGLCTDFGTQIRHDCSEAMVADANCCYCPTCQAVCTGKFPGCSKVWARGPRPVTLGAKGLGPSTRHPNGNGYVSASINGSGGNGSREPSSSSRSLPALPLGQPQNGSTVDPRRLDDLLEEIRLLRHQIDRTGRGGAGVENDLGTYFAATNTLLETLPVRIAEAMEGALANQHKMIMKDVETALRSFAGRLVRITTPPR